MRVSTHILTVIRTPFLRNAGTVIIYLVAAKMAIQPVAAVGVPTIVIAASGLIAKRRVELRRGTANCRDRQEDLVAVRIGCDRVCRARITRGNGRGAVLRRDR